jgi:Proline racemase
MRRQVGHDGVVDRAGGVVEEDVDAVRAGGGHRGREVGRGAVVDAGVVAEFPAPGELGLAARDRDRARALELGDLARDLADRAGRGRDHHGLAGLRPADLEEREIGGQTRQAEVAQRAVDRPLAGIDLARALRAEERVFLPAEAEALDDLAGPEVGVPRAQHLADPAAGHEVADLDARGVVAGRADAAAHVGIDREIARPHQDLARPRLGHWPLDQAPVVGLGQAVRVRRQQPLSVDAGHRSLPRTRSICRLVNGPRQITRGSVVGESRLLAPEVFGRAGMRWSKVITVVGAHAEGEVGRVITGGVIDVPGETMLDKMRHLNATDDRLRRFALFEPRGSAQMSANLLLPPARAGADAGFLVL